MTRDLSQLSGNLFDLAVIGGGITGAFAAWDAALRGLRVALIERSDFGGATSAASSKIIHGGIRYLQKGELHRVRESIRERAIFLRIAPHLVHPLPFLVPTYGHGMRGPEVLGSAMAVYDLLGFDRNRDLDDLDKRIPRHRMLSRGEALELEPELPPAGLTGGVRYHECHMPSSERMTLAVIQAAVAAGAVVANYAGAVGFLGDGKRVSGVRVRDALAGGDSGAPHGGELELRARVVANMTGPWAPGLSGWLSAWLANRRPRRFGLSKGVHIITRPLTRSGAIALATRKPSEAIVTRGGRHFFIIPWRNHSLIGTSNVPYSGDPAEVGVTEKDIADFIGEINAAYPRAGLERRDVRHFFGGLYPLVDKEIRAGVYQGTGQYAIDDHVREGVEGLITVIGARYTTARSLAQKSIDLVFRKLGRSPPRSRTAETPVHGGRIGRFADFLADAMREDERGLRLGAEVVRDLVVGYGTEHAEILKQVRADPESGKRVAAERPTIRAVVHHAVRREMALRLGDVVFRRTGLGTIGNPGEECLLACAAIMAGEFKWDRARVERELDQVREGFRTVG